jgi:glycosyltransferase involved in cell wall biosynthesis
LRKIADLYIVQATFILKLLVDLGIPETKIRIVPNGIDIKRFQPSEEAKIENLLLFVGRLDTEKGLPILLTALKYVKTSTRLVIIGPPSRPWFFKEILNSIKMINEKTIHRVAYLGILKTDEVIEWYQKASILVCASLSELFPMVNLEAMSCATAVIATNVGAIPEVVRDHKNGILVPPNDPVQLAEGIQYLLDHEEIRRRFAEEGRKWVVKNFASEVVIERLRQIYEEMI